MTVENIPHWTIRPNWRSPITERLEWLTALLESRSGAQQSFGLRMSPRRSFEALMTPVGRQRTLFDLAIGKVGYDPWYMPVWHDVCLLGTTLSSGSTSIPVETAGRDFAVGGFVMLTDDPFRSEVKEIASVASDSITLTAGTTNEWPAQTTFYPALKVRLDRQPEMQRVANRAFEGYVRFSVIGSNDVVAADVPTYLDLPVLTVAPNEIVDMTHAYERLFDRNDGDVGLVDVVHTSDVGFTVQGYNWTALGRQEHADLRALFYTLGGRNNPLWLPTFAEDFDVVSVDTGALVVARCGFTAYGGPREGRQDVQIALHDGTFIHARITGSSLGTGDTENIVLDETLSGVTVSDIKRVSFLSPCRMTSDSVELAHLTDVDGASQAAAQFRTAPQTRVAEDWDVQEYYDPVQGSSPCGGEE